MTTKICFRCKKLIEDKEHYMRFTEFHNEKDVKIDYCHKKCWDDFLKSITDTTDAKNMLGHLKSKLTQMGLLPEEEVVIK